MPLRCPTKMGLRVAATLILALLAVLLAIRPAAALPSYARQTGQECAACHNGFPELTPYGRLFKLNGYTFSGGTSNLPPLSVMLVPSFTHTQAGQQPGAAPHFGPNNNIAPIQSGSLFYGGAITSNVGAFVQATYDHVGRTFAWDNTDIRYAGHTNFLGSETVFGVSANNNPTVTDPWNSTPAWGFPFLSSALAPTPAASTLIEGGLAQQVAGLTAYTFWSRLVYAEIGAYHTLTKGMDSALGVNPTGTNSINGLAPYWRLAVEPKWGRHALEVGTFGLAASLNPGRVTGFGTDHTVDVGFDTQYQFLADRDAISLQASYILENQSLTASQAIGNTTNSRNHLRSLRVKTTYYRDQTYGGTLGYFNLNGTSDPTLFAGSPNDLNPNSRGWIGELDYIPFSHGGPSFWPWLNMKIGLQYVYYEKFNGGKTNFDGNGRSAHDNNTIFGFAWIAF
jgi:hypothetical protein